MSLLTCRDATHWCAVGGDVERRLAAKKRPAWPDHLDANYRRNGRWGSFRQVCRSPEVVCDCLASARLLHFGAAHERLTRNCQPTAYGFGGGWWSTSLPSLIAVRIGGLVHAWSANAELVLVGVTMSQQEPSVTVTPDLLRRLDALEAEGAVRRIMAECLEAGDANDGAKVAALFTADGVLGGRRSPGRAARHSYRGRCHRAPVLGLRPSHVLQPPLSDQ